MNSFKEDLKTEKHDNEVSRSNPATKKNSNVELTEKTRRACIYPQQGVL